MIEDIDNDVQVRSTERPAYISYFDPIIENITNSKQRDQKFQLGSNLTEEAQQQHDSDEADILI